MAILASTSGLIHPVCYAYSGTVLAFLWSFVYLYVAANMQCFGAAAILNGTVLIVAIPLAILGMRVAEKIMKKQAEKLH